MKLIPHHIAVGAVAVASLLAAAQDARTQNTNHTPGDLVLFFQNPGGSQGGDLQVFASLGNTATVFRQAYLDQTNLIGFLNIGTELSSAYGTNWASLTTLWGGLGGVWGTGTGSTLQNGDPGRTVYSSMPRNEVGTLYEANSAQLAYNTDTGITSSAGSITSLGNILETGASTQVATITNGVGQTVGSIHPIDSFGAGAGWNNTVPAPGVQQQGSVINFGAFGPVEDAEFLWDIYRVQARGNISGQFGEGDAVRQGLYLGTMVLGSNGDLSFIAVPEPGTWGLLLFGGAILGWAARKKLLHRPAR